MTTKQPLTEAEQLRITETALMRIRQFVRDAGGDPEQLTPEEMKLYFVIYSAGMKDAVALALRWQQQGEKES